MVSPWHKDAFMVRPVKQRWPYKAGRLEVP